MVRFFESCSLRNQDGVVLISDLRFDSEAEWLSRFAHQTIEVKETMWIKFHHMFQKMEFLPNMRVTLSIIMVLLKTLKAS